MEWISVEDRLPDKKQEVLVYAQFVNYSHGTRPRSMKVSISKRMFDEGLFISIPGWHRLNVTHWMPLPDKPCPTCMLKDKIKPSHDGSKLCESGSIASGGNRVHCTCDICF